MKKIISLFLVVLVIFTIMFKVGIFKDIKVFVLSKFNDFSKSIYNAKMVNQTKEKLISLIDDYEERLESYSDFVIKYEMLVKENSELRDLMNFKDDSYSIIYADIVEKSLIYDYVIINKGKENGIKVGSAVICSSAFIGVVDEVSSNSSTIRLINGMKYPVMNSSTYEVGSIDKYKDGYYIVKDFSLDVNVGDMIVTSKYSINIPSGLFIGTVEELVNDDFGLSKILKVKSGYDYGLIESVGVIVK